MELLPSSEQQQIIDATAAFLADRLPLRRAHGKSAPADVISEKLWREIAEMGWLGMSLNEACGGVGYGCVEEALVFWRLGRVLGPPRVLFTSVAARAAAMAEDITLAAKLAGGEAIACLAVQDDFSAAPGNLERRRLYDVKGAGLALAVDGDRARLIDLTGSAAAARDSLDKSVSMAIADLSGARVLCEARNGAIARVGALLCSAMLLGVAEVATEMIVDYAKIRHTFGRPIGAYQAVRHPCAEMAARCERAKSQLFMAAAAAEEGRKDADLLVSAARVLAEHAALQNTDDSIQLHGGIGVTDEFDLHLLLKRANVMTGWFGDRRTHLASIIDAPLQPLAPASRSPSPHDFQRVNER